MFSRGEGLPRGEYQSRLNWSKDCSPKSSREDSSRICSWVHRALRQAHMRLPTQPESPHWGQKGRSSRQSAG